MTNDQRNFMQLEEFLMSIKKDHSGYYKLVSTKCDIKKNLIKCEKSPRLAKIFLSKLKDDWIKYLE